MVDVVVEFVGVKSVVEVVTGVVVEEDVDLVVFVVLVVLIVLVVDAR